MALLVLLNKPYAVLSQFTDKEAGRETLAKYIKIPEVYVAGRLDFDSEGLLLLTDDGQLQHQIANPRKKMPKTYYVQVEGIPGDNALTSLRKGITLKDGPCLPAKVSQIDEPEGLWDRTVPIRYRKNSPTSWLSITITEGRNRQVRRMLAHTGFPVLRLIRWKVGQWSVEGLLPGESRIKEIAVPKKRSRKR